ncbi:hypothetical protein JCM11491_002973 [Sporobolomyces phaffii]
MQQIPAPIAGGLVLSFATSQLLLDQGRILGCSGIAHSTTERLFSTFSTPAADRKTTASNAGDQDWKIAAVLGIVAGGLALGQLRSSLEVVVGQPIFDPVASGVLRPLVAGLAVGAGTKLARGCTSGHMLIGMARFSKRSFAATLTFFPVAIATARYFAYPLPATTSSTLAYLDLHRATPSLAALFLLPLATSLLVHRILPPRVAALTQSFSLSFLFSLGLALTGMLRPSKVLSFFYIPISTSFATSAYRLPSWDFSLALVAIGGLIPNIFAWRAMKDRKTPRNRDKWDVPTGGRVDRALIFGSALFGLGWGLMGICPGPMLAVLGSGTGGVALSLFAGAFAAGGFVVNALT